MSNSKISALTSATTPLAGTEVLPIVQSSATVKVATNDLTVRNLRANATTGILQVTGPTAGTTRIATVPDANWTAARTDAAQSFSGVQGFTSIVAVGSSVGLNYQFQATTNVAVGAAGFSQTLVLSNQSIQSVTLGVANTTLQLQPNGADVSIGAGNLIPSTAAKGVNFTANTPASGMTSQLLNWYEEGTWTPNQGSGLTVVGAFSSAGTYTKIGRIVVVNMKFIGATSISVPEGGSLCSNLPFSVLADGMGGYGCGQNSSTGVVMAAGLYGTGAAYHGGSTQTATAGNGFYFTVTYTATS